MSLEFLKGKKPSMQQPAPPPPPQQQPQGMPPPGALLRENGVMMLVDEFNQEKIMPIVAQILEYNMLPEEERPEFLSLIINSPGGIVASAFHLIDTMNLSEIPIRTFGYGMIASCGILTIMSGQRGHRYMTANASMMSHQYSGGASGKEHEIYARMKEMEHLSDRMVEHYMACTKKSASYVRKHLLHSSDEWLYPEECLKHGIVDNVIESHSGGILDLKLLRQIEKEQKKG